MPQTGFTGISFPFRINSKGGVEVSSTSNMDVSHINEAIQQILLTRPGERCMEYKFKSDLDTDIFEPNDISARTLIEHQIRDALSNLEDRIEISNINVQSEGNTIIAELTYRVILYGVTYSTKVKVGDINETNNR